MIELRAAGIVAEPQIVFVTSVSSSFASVNARRLLRLQGGAEHGRAALRRAAGRQGIRVYEVRPGIIDTDMTRPVHAAYDERIAAGLVPIRRWGTPEDVGRAVAAIAAGAFPFSTGEVFDVDGGLEPADSLIERSPTERRSLATGHRVTHAADGTASRCLDGTREGCHSRLARTCTMKATDRAGSVA